MFQRRVNIEIKTRSHPVFLFDTENFDHPIHSVALIKWCILHVLLQYVNVSTHSFDYHIFDFDYSNPYASKALYESMLPKMIKNYLFTALVYNKAPSNTGDKNLWIFHLYTFDIHIRLNRLYNCSFIFIMLVFPRGWGLS